MSGDLVGVWDVALSDGVHRIEFEHGTTTGKRVICVDGKVWKDMHTCYRPRFNCFLEILRRMR